VRRGIEMAGERLAAADVELLSELAGSVDRRDDVFVRAERRVLTARRR
jgi:hypothetical protein